MNLVNCFRNDRCQKTISINTESDWILLHQGVPEGMVLGPLICNLCTINLNKQLTKSCKVDQCADDRILFCNNWHIETALRELEKKCSFLSKYFRRHLLQLNAEKTQLIIFSRNHVLKVVKIYNCAGQKYYWGKKCEISHACRIKWPAGLKPPVDQKTPFDQKKTSTHERTHHQSPTLSFPPFKWFFTKFVNLIRKTIKLGN